MGEDVGPCRLLLLGFLTPLFLWIKHFKRYSVWMDCVSMFSDRSHADRGIWIGDWSTQSGFDVPRLWTAGRGLRGYRFLA